MIEHQEKELKQGGTEPPKESSPLLHQRTPVSDHEGRSPRAPTDTNKTCNICQKPPVLARTLSRCGHVFCTECLCQRFEVNETCPVCGQSYKIQERGEQDSYCKIKVTKHSEILPGHEVDSKGTIGVKLTGFHRMGMPVCDEIAYLPDNVEGRDILRMMKKAFNARCLFSWTGKCLVPVKTGRKHSSHTPACLETSETDEHCFYPDPDYFERTRKMFLGMEVE